MWGVVLSDPRPVVGLVRRYHTNYLMGRSPLPEQLIFPHEPLVLTRLCGISVSFVTLSRTPGQVSYVFLTRPPLSCERSTCMC